jgi:bacillithiol biosynthesis cysteine-adding enzyme BshC
LAATSIGIRESGLFSKLICDYLDLKPKLRPLFPFDPGIGSFGEAIGTRNFPAERRAILCETLARQYSEYGTPPSALIADNIALLQKPTTFTVTTGHQLGIYTGPLYFVYKILTVIKSCEVLKAHYPQNDFVPVFWMAGEDHDFEEISSVHLRGGTVRWETDSAAQPVGRLSTASMQQAGSEVAALVAGSRNASRLAGMMNDHYAHATNLAQATHRIVNELFGHLGLVVIDPDDRELKKLLVPVMHRDILEEVTLPALKSSAALLKGYKQQVNGRPVNFFHIGAKGRSLLSRTSEGFVEELTGNTFSRDEMQAALKSYPERFSPNVVLRPVYQETILPNLAYVGGPGEIAYWLQLREVFRVHQTFFPVLLLRNSFVLTDANTESKLDRAGLELQALLGREDALVKSIISTRPEVNFAGVSTAVSEQLQQLIGQLNHLDNRLASQVIAQKVELEKFLEKTRKQADAARKSRNEKLIADMLGVREQLMPGGAPQERYDNILDHIQPHTFGAFCALVLDRTEPFNPAVQVIRQY